MKKMLCCMLALMLLIPVCHAADEQGRPVIGISWSSSGQEKKYKKKFDPVIKAAGGTPFHIPQITSDVCTYKDGRLTADMTDEYGSLKAEYADQIKACDFSLTNLDEAMAGVDGVFFVGGEDISPTLFAEPQAVLNAGEEINATRDISDYLLMAYCIQNDIPVFAACRGEQVMGIVCGCQFVQDIPDYYEELGVKYHDTHREPKSKHQSFARHDIDIVDQDSWTYKIIGADKLKKVASWHHQTVIGVEGTGLKVTATCTADGVTTIEGIELPECTYCVGMQFHPESDVYTGLTSGRSASRCDYDSCMGFFEALVDAAAGR